MLNRANRGARPNDRGKGPRQRHSPQVLTRNFSLKKNRFTSPVNFREPSNQYGKYPVPPKVKNKQPDALPVVACKKEIQRAIGLNDTLIIQAPTGTGKSTMIPQFCEEMGYKVNITQPRRMAAENIAGWIAKLLGTKVGKGIGFQHGLRQRFSPNNGINVLTDAFRLAQALGGAISAVDVDNKEVLILDEAHERNIPMEFLLALHKYKSEVLGEPVPKLIIMSATINPKKLVKFLGGNIPIIKIPGRTFPIKNRAPTASILTDIEAAVKKKENTLVFLPGKPEIAELRSKLEVHLRNKDLPAVVLPLHSGLSSKRQQQCLDSYDIPKVILATNVAEASITIPDIDYVIMSGLVKRMTIKDGIECLALMLFAKFNYKQQKGRGGRTKRGIVTYRGEIPYKNLKEEPPADIQNSKLEGYILRLLCSKYFSCREGLERLELLNPIPKKHMDDAFNSLIHLGLIGDHRGYVTDDGRTVASLPVSVAVGTLLNTANKKSLVWRDENIMRYAIDVAAVLTNGAIGKPDCKSLWKPYCEDEKDSDPLAQALLFQHALFLQEDQFSEHGFDSVAVSRCKDLRSDLLKRFRLSDKVYYTIDQTVRQEVLESIWTAMSSVIFQQKTTHQGLKFKPLNHPKNKDARRLGSTSILELDPSTTSFVIGHPFDILSYSDPEHVEVDHLLHMATRINMSWVKRHNGKDAKLQRAASSAKKKDGKEKKRFRNRPRGSV